MTIHIEKENMLHNTLCGTFIITVPGEVQITWLDKESKKWIGESPTCEICLLLYLANPELASIGHWFK